MTDRSFEDAGRDLTRSIKAAASHTKLAEDLGERALKCAHHGEYRSNGVRYLGVHENWTPCPDCEEARLAATRKAEAQEQAERARKHMEKLLGEAAIPKRFLARSLDNFHAATNAQDAALKIAREFAENFEAHAERGDSLIFSGLPGTGKSHLAIAVQQKILPAHASLYTTCANMIRAVRGSWRKDSERSEAQLLNAYGDVPLLVLDEIGVGYESDGERVILFDVLDRRYRERRPTILLTNLDRTGFKAFVGERTYDRLTETARWASFDWASYRPTARNEFGNTSSSNDPNFSRDERA